MPHTYFLPNPVRVSGRCHGLLEPWILQRPKNGIFLPETVQFTVLLGGHRVQQQSRPYSPCSLYVNITFLLLFFKHIAFLYLCLLCLFIQESPHSLSISYKLTFFWHQARGPTVCICQIVSLWWCLTCSWIWPLYSLENGSQVWRLDQVQDKPFLAGLFHRRHRTPGVSQGGVH